MKHKEYGKLNNKNFYWRNKNQRRNLNIFEFIII